MTKQIQYRMMCRNCEYGPCIAISASEEIDARRCPYFDADEQEAVFKKIVSPADEISRLFEFHERVKDDWIGDRWYPDWWWNMLGIGSAKIQRLMWALKDAIDEDTKCGRLWYWEESEYKKEIAKLKKTEIAQVFADLGFQAGLLYSEWRRKELGLEDIEIYEE